MEQTRTQVEKVVAWVGANVDDQQVSLLAAYAEWLKREAIPAGGIGPDEANRIWDRHICDSLAFAIGWSEGPPATAADVGTGVGLPGIPLSILWPDTQWSLIDRSRRRIELARRAVRVLDIANVRAYPGDVRKHSADYEAVVARGVLRPQQLLGDVRHIVSPGGRVAVGLTRQGNADLWRETWGRIVDVPAEILDGGGKILIIDSRDR